MYIFSACASKLLTDNNNYNVYYLSQRHTWRRQVCRVSRSAKIARCARCSDCDFRRSPRSAYKIADIWHIRYRRLNSPAFAKCARSRDFLRSLLRIASKANPSGWAILPHDFSKLPHRRDRRKKSPSVSASIGGEYLIGGEYRLRFSLAIKLAAIGV